MSNAPMASDNAPPSSIPAFIIDFEATTNKENAQATQLGFEQVDFFNGELGNMTCDLLENGMKSKSVYCKPDTPITLGAIAVAGICEEDVAGKPSHKVVVPQILTHKKMYVIGHNIDFDIMVAKNAGVDVSEYLAIDTCSMARMLYPDIESYSLIALLYHFKYSLARDYARQAHDAGFDVAFCYFILEQMCRDHGITSLEQLYEVSEKSRVPTHMPFGKHKGTALGEVPLDYVKWLFTGADDVNNYLAAALKQVHGITDDDIESWKSGGNTPAGGDNQELLTFPFGKHKGELFSEVPTDYLEWVLTLSNLRDNLRQAVVKELGNLRHTVEKELGEYPPETEPMESGGADMSEDYYNASHNGIPPHDPIEAEAVWDNVNFYANDPLMPEQGDTSVTLQDTSESAPVNPDDN